MSDEPRSSAGAPESGYGRRMLGAMVAGALLAAVASAAAGFALLQLSGPGAGATESYRRFLVGGGWLWIPLWGGALGLLWAQAWAPSGAARAATLLLAAGLAALPLALKPVVPEALETATPRTPRAKTRAILRWSYQSPAGVGRVLALSRDPDPEVREQAVIALGVNLIVTDIENASMIRPSRYRGHPLRGRLGARLREVLASDPVEAIRAEAARALWKAPLAFGRQPAAAETLAAMLDRADPRAVSDRLAWLALDAAAGAPDSALVAAARRFAEVTTDGALRRAARRALRLR